MLRNRGLGIALDVRVSFTGSAAISRIAQIEAGQAPLLPEVNLSDAPFFHKASEQGEFRIRFNDRFGAEYEVVLPVQQELKGDRRIDPLPTYGTPRVIEPRISKKRLREIGGS
jgi:hypothetical protein